MTETARHKALRLLLPRVPPLLVAAPLLALMLVGDAALVREGEILAWNRVADGLFSSSAYYDAPERSCAVLARARADQLRASSPFRLRRWLQGDELSSGDRATLADCVDIARVNLAADESR